MPSFSTGSARLNYVDVGSGVPFVFQHGIGGDVRQPLGAFTPPPHVRLLSFDARAHGDTVWSGSPEELSFDSFADDLLGLLDFLEIDRAVIGGISMGAGVALNFGVRYPERLGGLILSRPAWLDGPLPGRMVALFALVARLLRELDFSVNTDEGLDWAWRRLEKDRSFARLARDFPATAWSLRRQLTATRALEGVSRLERLPRDRPIPELKAAGRVRVPTLVLAHRDDPMHPFEVARRLATALPDAALVEVAPKSLDTQLHAMQVQQHIRMFLEQLRAPTTRPKLAAGVTRS